MVFTGVGEVLTEDESLAHAYVTQDSIRGFNVVGLRWGMDGSDRLFGRMPIMIFDGLSVSRDPFQKISIEEAKKLAEEKKLHEGFFTLDRGNYLACTKGEQVEVYHRLNPFEPEGHFVGSLG